MSHPTKKLAKQFDEYEGNGPRPPVPGEECHVSKMTTEGACSTSDSNDRPETESEFNARVERWQKNLTDLLNDNEGVALLFKCIEGSSIDGINSIEYNQLQFYFACEGLKQQATYMNEDGVKRKIRKLIRLMSDKYVKTNIIPASPELRENITKIVRKEIEPSGNIYDELQKNVYDIIAKTIYPSTFWNSDVLIEYVQNKKKQFAEQNSVQASCSRVNAASSTTDGTATIGGRTVGLTPLVASSHLQTLHEDSELKISSKLKTLAERSGPLRLTSALLQATEKSRLEFRPEGATEFTHISCMLPNSSYNPVSRQDSERQSNSSANLTDSEVNSKDGRPYFHRKPMVTEDRRKCPTYPFKPMGQSGAVSNDRLEKAKGVFDPEELCRKLVALEEQKRQKQKEDTIKRDLSLLTDKLKVFSTAEKQRVFPPAEDDSQAILDDHVSRVFSPHLSPGTASPKHIQRHQHRSSEMIHSMPDFALRHSRSIPEHASTMFSTVPKKPGRWPSQQFDSGISCTYSESQSCKNKYSSVYRSDADDTLRKSSREDSRRMRRPLPIPGHPTNTMPSTSSHHTNSLPRHHDLSEKPDCTYAMYTYSDEKIPYRVKLQGTHITLKQYKEGMQKKGNFRFFFQTLCDDPANPVIYEEISDDKELLPIYEGKVMGLMKPE